MTAEAGYQVTLVDQNEQILKKAVGSIQKSLQRSTKKNSKKIHKTNRNISMMF